MFRRFIKRLWVFAELYGWAFVAKVIFRLLINSGSGPILLRSGDIRAIQEQKRVRRTKRLAELGAADTDSIDDAREDLVSIGVFACNRFDLLSQTCEALARFLSEYGGSFRHEVILFHDGENAEIQAWAEKNPLFDRILFNTVNHGLSRNINRFWFEESKGKYLMSVEEDQVCEFERNFVRDAIDVLDTDDAVGCVRFGRWYPDDFREWNTGRKMNMRIVSAQVFETPSGYQYRLLEKTAYDNTASLHRFSALALTGRMREDIPRRAQEGEYLKRYNLLWQGARGVRFEDNPFLHIGEGRSCPTWESPA